MINDASSPSTPVTVIAESNGGGHRLVYVRLLVARAAQEGHDVVLALPQTLIDGEEFAKHLSPVKDLFRLRPFPEKPSLSELASLSRQLNASTVVIPDGDAAALKLGLWQRWAGGSELRVLVMRDPRWTRNESGRIPPKSRLKLAILRRAQRAPGVSLIWLREPGYRANNPEKVAHDPIVLDAPIGLIRERARAFRESHGLRDDVHWFGVVGAITPRKNVDLIASALAEIGMRRPARIGLAVLGPLAPSLPWTKADLHRELRESNVELVVDDRIYTNLDVNVAVASVECVVMAYSSHSPNATLGKATALGVALVAAGPPSVRGFVSQLHGGEVARLEKGDLGRALARHLDSPVEMAPRNPDVDDFAGEMLGVSR